VSFVGGRELLGDDAFEVGVEHGLVKRVPFSEDAVGERDPALGAFGDLGEPGLPPTSGSGRRSCMPLHAMHLRWRRADYAGQRIGSIAVRAKGSTRAQPAQPPDQPNHPHNQPNDPPNEKNVE